jgi:hypothetical protein
VKHLNTHTNGGATEGGEVAQTFRQLQLANSNFGFLRRREKREKSGIKSRNVFHEICSNWISASDSGTTKVGFVEIYCPCEGGN